MLYGAKLQLCFPSSNFWGCPVFPFWCRGLIFGAACRPILQWFHASWVSFMLSCFLCFDVTQFVTPMFISYATGRVVSGGG
jgi:hypothetical protein